MTTRTSVDVETFHDPATGTCTHLVCAGAGTPAAIIDPVLDYDPKSGQIQTRSAERLLDAVARRSLQVAWILETHAHADHLTAAAWLKRRLGGQPHIAAGRGITTVQQTFRDRLGLGDEFPVDGRQFDRLFDDGDSFAVGALEFSVLGTPGHTRDSITYRVGDAAFIGDTLFAPEYGTARCDFPGGDARQLYASVRRLLSLPDAVRLFLCHDYPPTGREPTLQTSPAAQRAGNIHVHDGVTEEQYVAMRQARDATLAVPVLLWPSLQVNIRAGELPDPDAAGRRFLQVPLSGAVDWR